MLRFQRSETTSRIIAYLRSLDKGTLVSYGELSRIVGEPIDSRASKLTTAIRVLQRDHTAVWVRIAPHVGVRRLTDVEIAERLPRWWLATARRKLTRGGSEANVVEPTALDINEQARFGVARLQRHLAEEALSRTARTHLERASRGQSNDLPTFNIMELAMALTSGRRR